ncbi:amidophosphoribosyltransferase [Balneolaceae bacterium ANBcel3]|nr:amidophosphoribosyltransferase [Balneolaceae bacterium ANBcel3]
MPDKPHDYCGIFGMYNHPEAAVHTYYGLHALQHRGQESAGIVTSWFDPVKSLPVMPQHKGFGLVLSVFENQKLFTEKLLGHAAIGHNRYSTSGSADNATNIQPFRVHYKNGNLAIAHNGNLTNSADLRNKLEEQGVIFQSSSDTELILHLISHSKKATQLEQIMDALHQIEGAYCLLLLTDDKLIAVRDPNGFRPLALGRKEDSWIVASETCAFDINNATYIRDIEPGEVVIIDRQTLENNEPRSLFLNRKKGTGISQCIFEYIYFSRPDSRIFGENTDKVRRKIGKYLAREFPIPELSQTETDKYPIVISVPDSSNTAALGYAHENQKLGHSCKFEIGLIRNHYIGRTFISPGQTQREQKVRTKFNTVKGVLNGRVVFLVDDSIVRGTTSAHLVKMIREAGPKEIHFLVSSPPVVHPCYYGMDFPSPEELIANVYNHDYDKIASLIGVDSLNYLSPEGLIKAVDEANPGGHGYCTACFTGKYPVPVSSYEGKEANDYY